MSAQTFENGHKPGKRARIRRLLRAANTNARGSATLKPGPFDANEFQQQNADHPIHALVTGLLVIYPVLASVAVVVAGMWLLGASHPA